MTLGPWGEVMTVSVLKVPAKLIAARSASRRWQRAATPPGEKKEEEEEEEEGEEEDEEEEEEEEEGGEAGVEKSRVAIVVAIVFAIVLPLSSSASPQTAILRPQRARESVARELMARLRVGYTSEALKKRREEKALQQKRDEEGSRE